MTVDIYFDQLDSMKLAIVGKHMLINKNDINPLPKHDNIRPLVVKVSYQKIKKFWWNVLLHSYLPFPHLVNIYSDPYSTFFLEKIKFL